MIINPIVDYRFDPFTGVVQDVAVTERSLIPANSPYWIQLNELPKEDTPSTVTVTQVGGGSFTEVASPPAAGEYRVDYQYKTGLVEFNSADAGKEMEITYRGLGAIVLGLHFQSVIDAHDPAKVWSAWHEYKRPGPGILTTDIGSSEVVTLPAGWHEIARISTPILMPHIYNGRALSLEVRSRIRQNWTIFTSQGANDDTWRVRALLEFNNGIYMVQSPVSIPFSGNTSWQYGQFDFDFEPLAGNAELGQGDGKKLASKITLICEAYNEITNTEHPVGDWDNWWLEWAYDDNFGYPGTYPIKWAQN